MGTEKKKHRRSSEPSSPQRDELKRKRHRSEEDEREGKREKKDGSRKEKKHKSHKSSKRRSDKEKSGEKHKSKSHKHKDSSKLKFEELSKDDYFSKNNEFAAWLKENKNLFFMDLSSEAAHDLFLDFVKEWNKGKLASEYYEGISTGPRSSHKWNIKQDKRIKNRESAATSRAKKAGLELHGGMRPLLPHGEVQNIFYGAYQGYGFHEDGLKGLVWSLQTGC